MTSASRERLLRFSGLCLQTIFWTLLTSSSLENGSIPIGLDLLFAPVLLLSLNRAGIKMGVDWHQFNMFDTSKSLHLEAPLNTVMWKWGPDIIKSPGDYFYLISFMWRTVCMCEWALGWWQLVFITSRSLLVLKSLLKLHWHFLLMSPYLSSVFICGPLFLSMLS